ncbi:MAG: hypothetical protein ABSF45_29855 [Terriglobia bacterium]|jgi:hypothetical protein
MAYPLGSTTKTLAVQSVSRASLDAKRWTVTPRHNPRYGWNLILAPSCSAPSARHKVEKVNVTLAPATTSGLLRYSQLLERIMQGTECSKRTAQLAISQACQKGSILQDDGHCRLPG